MKQPLIVLTGPTAVGKTSLSISLAKAVNGEIISADSMQVYKKMDIGSAKIRSEEMQGIPQSAFSEMFPPVRQNYKPLLKFLTVHIFLSSCNLFFLICGYNKY